MSLAISVARSGVGSMAGGTSVGLVDKEGFGHEKNGRDGLAGWGTQVTRDAERGKALNWSQPFAHGVWSELGLRKVWL